MSLQPEATIDNRELREHDYLTSQLITYLGNKRHLVSSIDHAVRSVVSRMSRPKIRVADLFSGSGVVSRLLMRYASELHANDLEYYAKVINRCFLRGPNPAVESRIAGAFATVTRRLSERPLNPGIIARRYAPADDRDIRPGERVFYTRRNACYLDTARILIGDLEPELQPYLLGPLLSEASVHANTAGVFKGFYKDRATGVGKFGGSGADALSRITGELHLAMPVRSSHAPAVHVHREDANELARQLPALDLVYIDPPYNQHPYGSNYFMLNLLCEYREPQSISRVAGIPTDWNRSRYNRRAEAEERLDDLLTAVDSEHLLVSFNSEGFIPPERMLRLLKGVGRVDTQTTRYPTFRGSRNLRQRSRHVEETLYLIRR